MPGNQCIIRVRLPRPLFRKLAARAIEERTDLNSLVIRAVQSDLPAARQELVGAPRSQAKPPRS